MIINQKTRTGVIIRESDNINQSLRKFKKKVEDSGLLKEVRERQQYVKPSIKRKLAKNAAKKRWQKKLRMESLPERQY